MIFLYNIEQLEQCVPNLSPRSPHQPPKSVGRQNSCRPRKGPSDSPARRQNGASMFGFLEWTHVESQFFFKFWFHIGMIDWLGIYSWNNTCIGLIESTKLGINKHRDEGTRRIRNFTNKESDLTNLYICIISPCSSFPHFPLWHTMGWCWGDTHRITIE